MQFRIRAWRIDTLINEGLPSLLVCELLAGEYHIYLVPPAPFSLSTVWCNTAPAGREVSRAGSSRPALGQRQTKVLRENHRRETWPRNWEVSVTGGTPSESRTEEEWVATAESWGTEWAADAPEEMLRLETEANPDLSTASQKSKGKCFHQGSWEFLQHKPRFSVQVFLLLNGPTYFCFRAISVKPKR